MLRRPAAYHVSAYLQAQSRILLTLVAVLLCLLLVIATHTILSAYYQVIPEHAGGDSAFWIPELQVAQNGQAFAQVSSSLTRIYVVSYVTVSGPSLIDPTKPAPEQQVVFSDETQ